MYTSGGRRGVAGRASFVECGLILMGADDKQRKQASSLPGEICLLLAGVQQWGRYTRASRTPTSQTDDEHGSAPSEAIPRRIVVAGRSAYRATSRTGRATPERAQGDARADGTRRGHEERSPQGPIVLRAYTTHVPAAGVNRTRREDDCIAVTYLL